MSEKRESPGTDDAGAAKKASEAFLLCHERGCGVNNCGGCKYFLDAVILPCRCSFTGERAYADLPGCGHFAETAP
jgi:hypothetical protein